MRINDKAVQCCLGQIFIDISGFLATRYRNQLGCTGLLAVLLSSTLCFLPLYSVALGSSSCIQASAVTRFHIKTPAFTPLCFFMKLPLPYGQALDNLWMLRDMAQDASYSCHPDGSLQQVPSKRPDAELCSRSEGGCRWPRLLTSGEDASASAQLGTTPTQNLRMGPVLLTPS